MQAGPPAPVLHRKKCIKARRTFPNVERQERLKHGHNSIKSPTSQNHEPNSTQHHQLITNWDDFDRAMANQNRAALARGTTRSSISPFSEIRRGGRGGSSSLDQQAFDDLLRAEPAPTRSQSHNAARYDFDGSGAAISYRHTQNFGALQNGNTHPTEPQQRRDHHADHRHNRRGGTGSPARFQYQNPSIPSHLYQNPRPAPPPGHIQRPNALPGQSAIPLTASPQTYSGDPSAVGYGSSLFAMATPPPRYTQNFNTFAYQNVPPMTGSSSAAYPYNPPLRDAVPPLRPLPYAPRMLPSQNAEGFGSVLPVPGETPLPNWPLSNSYGNAASHAGNTFSNQPIRNGYSNGSNPGRNDQVNQNQSNGLGLNAKAKPFVPALKGKGKEYRDPRMPLLSNPESPSNDSEEKRNPTARLTAHDGPSAASQGLASIRASARSQKSNNALLGGSPAATQSSCNPIHYARSLVDTMMAQGYPLPHRHAQRFVDFLLAYGAELTDEEYYKYEPKINDEGEEYIALRIPTSGKSGWEETDTNGDHFKTFIRYLEVRAQMVRLGVV